MSSLSGTNKWDALAPGYPGRLSPEQERNVTAFLGGAPAGSVDAARLPEEPPAYFACRMLRARKYDVEKALALLKETVEWRAERRVRELAATPAYALLGGVSLDELQPLHPKAYFPFPDREGRPIYIERTGRVDAELLNTLTDLEHLELHHIHAFESDVRRLLTLASRSAGRPVTSLVTILDMAHMTLKLTSASARAYVGRMQSIDSSFYPELLGAMLIINAPTLFTVAWGMVKGFLDERTVRKIKILGGPAAWEPELAKLIDPEHTPTEYGGRYEVPGGLFHESRTQATHLAAGKQHAESVLVRAGQSVRFKWLARPAAALRFSVTFQPGDGCGSEAEAPMTSAAAACSPPPDASAVPLHEQQEHARCDREWVSVTCTAPPASAGGVLRALWSNAAGWVARELLHRWDYVAPESGVPDIATTYTTILKPAPHGPFSAAAIAQLDGGVATPPPAAGAGGK